MVRLGEINNLIQRRGLKINRLAERLMITPKTLSSKLKRGNFSAEEFLRLMVELNVYGDRIYNYIEITH